MTTQHDDRCESLAMHLAAANHALDLFHAELAEILDNPFAAKADPRIVEVQSHAALASTALAQSRAHLATFRGLDVAPRELVEEQQT